MAVELDYLFVYIFEHPVPSKSIGTARPTDLFLLCIEDICVWDSKENNKQGGHTFIFHSLVFYVYLLYAAQHRTEYILYQTTRFF